MGEHVGCRALQIPNAPLTAWLYDFKLEAKEVDTMAFGRGEINWKKVAEYMANFFSNLAVIGIGLAIFREERVMLSCGIAVFALAVGALITAIIARKEG